MEVLDSIVRRSKSVGRTLEAGRLSSIGVLGKTIWSAAAATRIPRVREIRGRRNVGKNFIGWGSQDNVLIGEQGCTVAECAECGLKAV